MKKNDYWRIPIQFGVRRKWLLAMKISVILLLAFNLSLSASVLSQARVALNLKNASFIELIQELESKTDLGFIYNQNDIKDIDVISLDTDDISVEDVLDAALEDSGLEYEIDRDIIIIRPAKVVPTQKEVQEKKSIKGKVTDDQGIPLPGVSVVVKGTNIGVATNIDGEYTLEFEQKNVVLVYSFVGMTPQEIAYSGQEVIDVTLGMDSEQMAEVVVTGYQTISKERATGSFASIKSEDLEDRISINVEDKLKGMLPGLQVDKENNIIIRGISSLTGNTKPLVVIDGFPVEDGLETVNPDDIENVTVLKDASAASIWGTRAANGVIVISTRKAKKGKGLQIEASYYKTIVEKPDYKSLEYMNSAERVDFELSKLNDPDNFTTNLFATYYEGPNSELNNAWLRKNYSGIDPSLAYTEAEFNAEVERLRNADGWKQFSDLFLQQEITNQYNVSARNVSENNAFAATFAYYDSQGNTMGINSDKMILNIKNDLKITDRLNFDLSVNLVGDEQKNRGLNVGYFKTHDQYNLIKDENGDRYNVFTHKINNKAQYDEWGLDYTYNPYDEFEGTENSTERFSIRANAGLRFKIMDGLNFSSKFQYVRSNSKTKNLLTTQNPNWRNTLNDFYIDGEIKHLPYGGKLNTNNSNSMSYTLRNQIDFTKTWNEKHSVNAIAGQEIGKQKITGNGSMVLGYNDKTNMGFPYDAYNVQNRTLVNRNNRSFYENPWPTLNHRDNRDVSYYANVSYNYDRIYTITGSYRLDQANVFGASSDAKNNVLWSVGGSYNIKEALLGNNDQINRLIFRATYGSNGNRPEAQFTSFLTGTVNQKAYHGPSGVPSVSLNNPENKDLRAEKVYTANIGLDYALFNSRVRGSIEAYQRNSVDLIAPRTLNPATGWDRLMVNYGKLENRGVEFMISVTPFKTADFNWDVDFNISYNENKITDLVNNVLTTNSYLEPMAFGQYAVGSPVLGKPINRVYAYNYEGLDENGELLLRTNDGDVIKWDEVRNYHPEELVKYQGTLKAPWFGSLRNTLKYKNFTLSFILNYKFGHKFYAPLNSRPSTDNISNKIWSKAWTPENTNTTVPRIYPLYSDGSYSVPGQFAKSDINVLDAAWIKLSDVNLSYNLPKHFIAWSGIKAASLKFQVKNLASWYANDLDIDPESQVYDTSKQYTTSYMNFKAPTTFIVGVKLNF